MPAKGWRKPPGYQGYRQRPRQRVTYQGPLPQERVTRNPPVRSSESEEEEAVQARITRKRKSPRLADMPPTRSCRFVVDDVSEDAEDNEEWVEEDAVCGEEDGAHAASEVGTEPEMPTNVEHPIIEVSMSVVQDKKHVHPIWQRVIFSWIEAHCIAGSVSLERGGRQEMLHCQVILRLRWDLNDMDGLKKIMKEILGVRRGDGSGCRIELHPFRNGQSWVTMVGYLFKDRDKVHTPMLRFGSVHL